MAQLGESFCFDLSDAFASERVVLADLVECSWNPRVEAVTHDYYLSFAFSEFSEDGVEFGSPHAHGYMLEGVDRTFVFDEIAKNGIVFSDWLEYRDGFWSDLFGVDNSLLLDARLQGNLHH